MFSPSPRALVALSATLCIPALTAQQAGPWLAVPVNLKPPARTNYTLTPYPGNPNVPAERDSLLLFGGDPANPSATEWLWNGVEWSPLTTPVPRRAAPAAASLINGDLLVFGGSGAGGVPLFDTWVCRAGVWSQVATTSIPVLTSGLVMAADASGGAVLVGANGPQVETWRFDNGQWTLRNASVPTGTGRTAFFDSVRGEVGLVVSRTARLDVYGLEGTSWELRSQPNSFFAILGVAAFDPERGRLLTAQLAMAGTDTYEWDGANLVSAGHTFNFFPTGPAAWHEARKEIVLVRSEASGLTAYRWAANVRPLATAYGTPCQDPNFAMGLAPGDSAQIGTMHRLQAHLPDPTALTFSVLGFSHTVDGGAPLPRAIPFGALGCMQRVQALVANLLSPGPVATQPVLLPNSSSLLGMRYDAQFLQVDALGVLDASGGLEVQIGTPITDRVLTESFNSPLRRDAIASGDAWTNGAALPVAIGGDGRHGSFDPSFGTQIAPGHYEWNTDNTTIPATNTLSGVAEVVTDGEFSFTDFLVPAGVTVSFTGSAPPRIRVRGRADVQGTLLCNAEALPYWIPTTGLAAGQRVSDFDARGGTTAPAPFVQGQPGTRGGPGGGRGGKGGDECQGLGPIIVGGVVLTDGQNGQDVRIAAGHAYAAFAAGTGGRGSGMNPPSGIPNPNTPLISFVYRAFFAPGGGGGGFDLPGGTATLTPLLNMNVGATPAGGTAFPVMPYPPNPLPNPGYSSLDHFVVGGSGGGGGGTHAYGTIYVVGDVYTAGSGGSGGGGALALRSGGDLTVGSAASLQAKGGDGVVINGQPSNGAATSILWGISSPGGGGSGGSLLLQSAGNVVVDGDLDTRGGPGSRTGLAGVGSLSVQSQAGAGSNGFVRLEAGGSMQFTGTSVPAIVGGTHTGPLSDRDVTTGSRSLWLVPPSVGLPAYLRYELVADVNGSTLLFSDDPSISILRADDPAGPVLLRLQGARVDSLTGLVDPASIGPWRSTVLPGVPDSLNRDRGTAVRFDLVLNKSHGFVRVLELRLVWR